MLINPLDFFPICASFSHFVDLVHEITACPWLLWTAELFWADMGHLSTWQEERDPLAELISWTQSIVESGGLSGAPADVNQNGGLPESPPDFPFTGYTEILIIWYYWDDV